MTPHSNGSRKNGQDHCQAHPSHPPVNGTKHEESQVLDTAVSQRFNFEGAQIRVVLDGNNPWFVAADVCRALNIAPSNGGYGSAMRKLDVDEKRQISRSMFDGDHQSLNDGVVNGDNAANAWLVSESGLYLLILRSRAATTPGTVPYRFRRWVTGEVLPSIRAAGSYGHSSITAETVTLSLTDHARYVVMVTPNKPPHVRKPPYDKMLDEWSGLDTEILANHMRTVDALWQKTQLVRSLGGDPAGSPLYNRLGKAISEGRRIADECLDSFRQQPD